MGTFSCDVCHLLMTIKLVYPYIIACSGPFVNVFGPFNFVLKSWHLIEVVEILY